MDTQAITQGQVCRCAFIVVIVVCLGCACVAMLLAYPTEQSTTLPIPEKINPNTATVGSLIRLPGIGLHRAQVIISYRDQYYQQYAGQAAFQCQSDLVKIRGLGEKTVAGFCQYLDFK